MMICGLAVEDYRERLDVKTRMSEARPLVK
jgi:hypothetical protein